MHWRSGPRTYPLSCGYAFVQAFQDESAGIDQLELRALHVHAEWFERPDLKIKSRLFSSGLDSSYVANVGAERSPSLAATAFLYRLTNLTTNITAPTTSTSQNITRLIPMPLVISPN